MAARPCLHAQALGYREVLQASYWPVPSFVVVVAVRTGSCWDRLRKPSHNGKLLVADSKQHEMWQNIRPGGYPG